MIIQLKIIPLLSALLLIVPATSFTLKSSTTPTTRSTNNIQCSAMNDRRNFIQTITSVTIGTIISSSVAIASPSPALAEVAKGDSLPEGAAQFKRLLNLKSDIPLIIKRLTENASDIDSKEWDNLSDFLRRLYKGGDDMKNFAKSSIYDPEKKKSADEYVKTLQKLAQAGDSPVSKQDAEAYAMLMKKSDLVLENFFDLLRDVPDEL